MLPSPRHEPLVLITCLISLLKYSGLNTTEAVSHASVTQINACTVTPSISGNGNMSKSSFLGEGSLLVSSLHVATEPRNLIYGQLRHI